MFHPYYNPRLGGLGFSSIRCESTTVKTKRIMDIRLIIFELVTTIWIKFSNPDHKISKI